MARKAVPLVETESQATKEIPLCPDWLSAEGRSAWPEITQAAAGVLTAADGPALAVLAETFGEWRQLSREIAEEGRTYTCVTEKGSKLMRPNPKMPMISDAFRRLIAVLSEFGLSPAGRAKNKPRKPQVFSTFSGGIR